MRLLRGLALAALAAAAAAVEAPVAAASGCEVPPGLATARPDPAGKPTRVTVGLFLVDLRRIDDAKQSFDADVLLRLTWQDPRLAGPPGEGGLEGCLVPLESVWNPRIALVNERGVQARFEDSVVIGAGGEVQYTQRFQGEFSSPLVLTDFPLDRHRLPIQLVARTYRPEEVELVPDPQRTDRAERLTIADWTMEGTAEARVEPLVSRRQDMSRAAIVFEAEVARRIGFYVFKVLLPLSLIVLMSWAVFWINPSFFPSQIAVATSAVLTLIAFQFSLGYLLPRLSYLTRADRFLMGATLLVFAAFAEAVVTGALSKADRQELAQRIDRWSRWVFLAGFVAVAALSFLV